MAATRTRELDFRSNDGLEVALLWEPAAKRLKVAVRDTKGGDDFELDVSATEALDAFNHPYAYAARRGIHFLAGTPAPTEAVPV